MGDIVKPMDNVAMLYEPELEPKPEAKDGVEFIY
jgi:hypothetical protein